MVELLERRKAPSRRATAVSGRPDWRGLINVHGYFHGDDGSGLGASHQTGWTVLVAHLILRRKLLPFQPRAGALDLASSA